MKLVICFAYLPYDSEDPPPSKELEELVRYCENENLYPWGVTPMHIIVHEAAQTATVEGRP
jgi:hypothetical protein